MTDGAATPTRRAVLTGAAAGVLVPAIAGAQHAAATAPMADAVPVGPALARFIADMRSVPLAAPIREHARLHVLDTIAAAIACRELEPAQRARDFIGGNGEGRIAPLGSRRKASLTDAAFVGAMTANAAEINDFIPSAYVQPGPAVLATALAVAQVTNANGEALLRAVLTGYELAGRFPKAIGLAALNDAGISTHAIGALFGSAGAAASLLALDSAQIGHMFAFAAQQASGSMQWLLDVEHIEKTFVFCGMAARAGLTAALLAKSGWRGTRDALDVTGGWMTAAPFRAGDWQARRRAMIADLGRRFEIEQAAFKRYPVGGPTQPGVAGVLQLLPRIGTREVQAVRIAMPGRAEVFAQAQMPALNLRYTASLALIDRGIDFEHVQSRERFLHDAAVQSMMARVTIVHDPAQEVGEGRAREESARVAIMLADGERVETFVPYVLGYPSHPMARADVEAKARDLIAARDPRRTERIVALAGYPDRMARAADLVALTLPGK